MFAAIPDWVQAALLTGAITGLVTWGSIRAQLTFLQKSIERVEESADEAHKRMDRWAESRIKYLEDRFNADHGIKP